MLGCVVIMSVGATAGIAVGAFVGGFVVKMLLSTAQGDAVVPSGPVKRSSVVKTTEVRVANVTNDEGSGDAHVSDR